MSDFFCDHCDAPISADDDLGALAGGRTNREIVLCEACLERAWDRQQERLMEDGPGPSLLEQQQAAWRLK